MIDAQVTVAGNVTADPVVGWTKGGDPFTSFRLAVNHGYFDRERGQWLETGTSYYKISAFGPLAVNTFESIQKGTPIMVQGKLRLEDWESGDKRGTSAVIKAAAIGPNLTYGQADFTAVKRPQLATNDPLTDPNVRASHGEDSAGSQGPGDDESLGGAVDGETEHQAEAPDNEPYDEEQDAEVPASLSA